MKSKLLLLSLLIFTSTLFSQTLQEKSKIINKTNVTKLLEFSKVKKAQAIKDKEIALSVAKIKGWEVFIQNSKSYSELMRVDKQGNPIYYSTNNYGAGLTARTNHLYSGGSLGINIEGQNMIAGEWDGGGVLLSHELFEGRVTQMDSPASTHYHSTHVAGTIIGTDQVVSGDARGMAFKANLQAYDWTNDTAEVATAAANGLLISNHSYGYTPDALPLERFGKYDSDSNGFDAVMYDAPYYLFVAAAGNTRNDGINTGDGGYDLLTGHSVSKNSMVVAAVNEQINYTGPSSVVMSSFSSWGPTDDGRIKPDISAKGVNTFSATDTGNSNYITISGTSMAAPSATGALLLLQQYYNQQNSTFMLSSTLRGLALHTADEAGSNPGPDYEFGWGLINIKKATEVIRDNNLYAHISENTLNQGETFNFSFNALGTEPVMASICWTDPAGTIITNSVEDFYQVALVNDLDVRITKNGTTYYPWKMDKDNHSAAATQGDNIVDNIEKVEITNPIGSYTLTVTHKGTLQSGSQNFSLIVSGISFNDFYISSSETETEICEGDNSTIYNLELSTIAGFSDTVNFSAINLPAGVNAVFTPTALSSTGTFDVELTNLSGLTAGNYQFIVHGQSASDSADLEMSLQVFSSGFSAITMNEPANNATSVQTDITFHWDEDPNAEEYDIEIATDSSFTNIVDSATVSEIPYQSAVLTNNTTYFWRVLPKNNCGTGSFSSEYNFTTTCVGPSNIVFTNINTNSVDLSWTENSGGTSWEVEIVENGSSPTGIGYTATNPYSFTGLTSNTTYTVYVRSNCGSGNFSDWITSSQFTTALDFCSGDHFYDTGGVSGNYSDQENYTITMVPSIGNNAVQVVFNTFQLESCCDLLSIYDGGDINAPLLGSYTGTTNPGSFISTNASGSLTFKFTSDGSVTFPGWDATVTCLNITCPTPTNLVASNVTANSTDLSWTVGDSETAWEVEYGAQGYTQGSGTTVSASTNPFTLTGLNSSTDYDVYLRANCGTNSGDDDSLWFGPVSFTTLISCPAPTNLMISSISLNSVVINWTAGGSETAWEMEYGTLGFTQGTGTTVSTSTNPFDLNVLSSATNYDVYIRANCGTSPGDDDSFWVGPVSFTTASDYCNGDPFYDTGGVSGDYSNSENYTITMVPSIGNNAVQVIFNTFQLESCCDLLSIYDGGDINAPLLGSYTGTTNPGSFTSTNASGSLTFKFTSDGSVTFPGWDATVTCLNITCPTPTNLVASNVTADSTDLSWTVGNSETVWEVEYGAQGYTQGSGTTVSASTNPFTLTGLNYSTDYDVYLRANCGTSPGDDDSLWVGPISFTTICGTLIAPFTENFTSNFTPNCWSETGSEIWNYSTGADYQASNAGDHSNDGGTNYAWIDGSSPNGASQISTLISPSIDISTLTVPMVDFSVFSYNPDDGTYNTLDVELYDGTNWNSLLHLQESTGGWTTYQFSLTSFTITGDIQLKFTIAENSTGNPYHNDILLDDISVMEAPSCPNPTNLTTSIITPNSVDLNWTAGDSETAWEVEYGAQGYTQGTGTTVSASTNPYTLTGLNSSTDYDVYLRANCGTSPGDDDSNWFGPVSFSSLVDYCNGDHFYDTGGVSGSYSNNEDYSITITPNTGYNAVEVVFNTFQLEGCCDYLKIYDGVDTSAPLLGSFNGSTNPGSFTSSNASGVLTFKFTSDSSGTYHGWDATINCLNITCPTPTNLVTSNVTSNSTDLSWTAGDSETAWEVEYGAQGYTQGTGTTVSASTNPYTLTGLNSSTDYDVYLRANCGTSPGDDDSNWVGPVSFSSLVDYCNGGHFYDTGGVSGSYSNNEDYSITITPNTGYNAVEIVFNEFNLESGYDNLSIYDGMDISAPLLGTFTGTTNPGSFISTNSSGSLTFRFTSDNSQTQIGWDASVTCLNTAGIDDLSTYNFTYYPNPFKNTLTVTANTEITSIRLYTVLGQELMRIKPNNQSEIDIDVSKISSGTYFMKVEIDGKYSTIKLLK